jgi:hypothetical protein
MGRPGNPGRPILFGVVGGGDARLEIGLVVLIAYPDSLDLDSLHGIFACPSLSGR